MKRYDLTEDGYRRKFRASKPEVDENPEQFIVRLDRYLLRWLGLSKTERSFQGLKDLIVKEQFIDSCPKELAIPSLKSSGNACSDSEDRRSILGSTRKASA